MQLLKKQFHLEPMLAVERPSWVLVWAHIWNSISFSSLPCLWLVVTSTSTVAFLPASRASWSDLHVCKAPWLVSSSWVILNTSSKFDKNLCFGMMWWQNDRNLTLDLWNKDKAWWYATENSCRFKMSSSVWQQGSLPFDVDSGIWMPWISITSALVSSACFRAPPRLSTIWNLSG